MNAVAPAIAEQYLRIPLGQLHESKTNPRRHFNKDADAELAKSIKAQGVVQPIVVRPHPDGKGYELVAGARRFRQSKVAGVADIPAMVKQLTDAQVLEIQIVENLQRQDVHPYDEAFGYKALLEQNDDKGKPRYDVPAIAAKVGKSTSYVYMRLKLTELTKDAQDAFLEDKITAGHAEKIARLQPTQQAQALKQCTNPHTPMSVRALAEWIERNVHLDLAGAVFDSSDAKLIPDYGACTTCPKRTGTQPDLFPDVKKGDTCTDPKCFHAKTDRVLYLKRAAIVDNGGRVADISTEYYSRNKKLLNAQQYDKVTGKPCADTVTGLVVEGAKPGATMKICTNATCEVHHPEKTRANVGHAKAVRAKQAAVQQKREADEIVRTQVLRAVLKTYDKKPTLGTTELQILCRGVLDDPLEDDTLAVLLSHHAMRDAAAIEAAVGRCKQPANLQRWFFSLWVAALSEQYGAGFADIAKSRGVDAAKLRKQVTAQIKAKDKALAAANAKKAALQTSAKPLAAKAASKKTKKKTRRAKR